MPRGAHFTPELSREVGKLGGRPRGVLNKKTIEKMTTQEVFVKEIQKRSGLVANALFDNLIVRHDTSAGKELLDRAFGKAPQAIDMRVAVFSLKDLNDRAKRLEEEEKKTT